MNRLTDADWQGVIDDNVMPCPPTPKQLKEIAAEILTLRKENARLRKRVEVGEQMDWLISRELDNMDHVAEKAFRIVRDKWRESGVE